MGYRLFPARAMGVPSSPLESSMIRSLNTRNLLGDLLLGVFASGSAIAADGSLRTGIEVAYPPFSSKTVEGELVGFDCDIGNAPCT